MHRSVEQLAASANAHISIEKTCFAGDGLSRELTGWGLLELTLQLWEPGVPLVAWPPGRSVVVR